MWLKAPFGLEQVAGSLTRTFTNAPPFVVGDFPLLLQPETTSAHNPNHHKHAKLCASMHGRTSTGQERSDIAGTWERVPNDIEHSSFHSSGQGTNNVAAP